MRRFILPLLLAIFACNISSAQNNEVKADDFGRIVLTSYLDGSKTAIPVNAYNILRNKLSQIATQNGIAGNIPQRFIITANVNIVSKDITSTASPMHALTLETMFYIGDGVDGTLFSTTSVSSKGVGETEDKAFISALKSIKPSAPEFSRFIASGKRKIIEYYNANGEMYITKARTLAKAERFDDAIYMLMCIPDVCKDVYDKAMDEVSVIYNAKINSESSKYLAEARAIWNAGMDYGSAQRAGRLLAMVHPDASCYKSAVALSREIAQRAKVLNDRDWQYTLNEQKNAHAEKMSQISSAREIAVAFAKNQPKTIYNVLWW